MDAPPLIPGLVPLLVLTVGEVPRVGTLWPGALSLAAWLHATQAPGRAHAHAAGSLKLTVAMSLVCSEQYHDKDGWFRLQSTLCDYHGVPFRPHSAQYSSPPFHSMYRSQYIRCNRQLVQLSPAITRLCVPCTRLEEKLPSAPHCRRAQQQQAAVLQMSGSAPLQAKIAGSEARNKNNARTKGSRTATSRSVDDQYAVHDRVEGYA